MQFWDLSLDVLPQLHTVVTRVWSILHPFIQGFSSTCNAWGVLTIINVEIR